MNDQKLFGMPAEKGRWLIIPLGVNSTKSLNKCEGENEILQKN
jgi:hypothetical protein